MCHFLYVPYVCVSNVNPMCEWLLQGEKSQSKEWGYTVNNNENLTAVDTYLWFFFLWQNDN